MMCILAEWYLTGPCSISDFRVASRGKWYESVAEIQRDLGAYLYRQNNKRSRRAGT